MKKTLIALLIMFCMISTAVTGYAEEEPAAETETEAEETSEELFGYTTANLNMRHGAGTGFAVITTIARGGEVQIIGEAGDWYHIKYNGETGYACADYISTEDDGVSVTEEGDASASAGYDLSHIVKTAGFPSDANLEIADAVLNLAPEYQRQAFVDSGWSCILSEYDVDDTYAGGQYGSLLGITKYDSKTIYLDNRDVGADAALHEFGHFVDWYFGFPSGSSGFAPAYSREGSTFCSYFCFHNGVYNQQELFAEAYDVRIRRADELQSICPMIYDFMTAYTQ